MMDDKQTYIPIVFAFDNNYAKYAYVAIASLLFYKKATTNYKLYCIIDNKVATKNKQNLKTIADKYNTPIKFVNAENYFQDAHQHRGITAASYYRLVAHALIPQEDKIIYADVDILFNGDLSEVYEHKLGNNILAGVKNLYIYQVFDKHLKELPYWEEKLGDTKGTYINAGFLIMNLNKIRETKIWKTWLKLAQEKWEYHDQDILNMTCKGKILYLPPKYNATYPIRAKSASDWGLFTPEEINETPVVYHFTAAKPWNAKYMKQADVWWNFLKKNTDLYSFYYQIYKRNDNLRKKINRKIRRIKLIIKKFI